ncbi:peptidoglycan-binding domain-containing protein [Halotia branconii]|uniref:Peptidoglycan-binding domain-containing protein n=1 Tax=Halotia branconii CENA392 TaxID=1539056 RepID=A0AAJ6NNW1_9CYAN|nr:peptidoglycan-binding domain-containing protein [Halotia branconii]WGV23799.1 peptidoglycan-binding domain-containing protein [Halotia branconii CENA392]
MNDIVLLMTGVLIAKQPSPSNLLNQPVIQLDDGLQKPPKSHLYQVYQVPTSKIAPPEFIQSAENFPANRLAIKPEYSKTLMSKTDKNLVKDLYSLTEFQHFQPVKVKFPSEQRLIAQQSRDKIVVTKFQGIRFSNKQRLIAQQIDDDIVVAKNPRFSNPTVPTLRFNSSGLAVRILQRLLVANGYAIRVDGVFGALTETAVKAFQNQQNLAVDGIVGPRTWHSLTR